MKIFGYLPFIIFTLISGFLSVALVAAAFDPPGMGHSGIEIVFPFMFLAVNLIIALTIPTSDGQGYTVTYTGKLYYIVLVLSSIAYSFAAYVASS